MSYKIEIIDKYKSMGHGRFKEINLAYCKYN